jgi:hypothetical protein
MKNALPGLIVSILLLIFSNSCRKTVLEQHSFSNQKVELECKRGWLLSVQSDGSACLSYTKAKNCEVWLSSGTFPFQQLKLLPAFAPQVQDRYPFRWTYIALEEQEYRQYGLPDTSWAAQWFEQAYQALLLQENTNRANRKLRKFWKKVPPTGTCKALAKNTGSL